MEGIATSLWKSGSSAPSDAGGAAGFEPATHLRDAVGPGRAAQGAVGPSRSPCLAPYVSDLLLTGVALNEAGGRARAAAALRVRTPVRSKMCSMCLATVAGEMNRIRAMSALL